MSHFILATFGIISEAKRLPLTRIAGSQLAERTPSTNSEVFAGILLRLRFESLRRRMVQVSTRRFQADLMEYLEET